MIYKNKKPHKINKTKNITYQPKNSENPNIVDMKLIITEHPKTSHKLFKTIRQSKKVGFKSPLYSDTKK